MLPREWVEVAQVASTIIAATGLLLTACQMSRTRRTADLQALQKFSEDANKRESALADATTDYARVHAFNEFMNFLELYACAYNNGLVIGKGSKDIVRHKLLDSYIELDAAKHWHPHIERALDRSTTFIELRKLIEHHRTEVGRRRAEKASTRDPAMPRPRNIKKIVLPLATVQAMQPEHRSALLMLGLFLNEANWLRKLLVKAVQGVDDTPEGQASFALTTLLATTLAGKVHEGWDRISEGVLHDALAGLDFSESLKAFQQQIDAAMKGKTFVRIRNNIAFHYPERLLDFKKLTQHLSDSDATIFVVPEGYGGDVLSHISTLAGIEPLLAISQDSDYRAALTDVWEEVLEVAGHYCQFVSEVIATLVMKFVPNMTVEDLTVPDAPEAVEESLRFFVHPPRDLEEMRAAVPRS